MLSEKIYDIAIIGLGPAGAVFAGLLKNDFSVIAFDKKCDDETTGFKKPCGGLLAPNAQRFFAKLGLTLPLDVLVDPQIFSVKTIDVKTKDIKYYQRFYINLDRHKFDNFLKSKIHKSVEIKDNFVCTDIKYNNNIYEITGLYENREYVYKAKYLVGADGASSLVRKKLFSDKKIRTYVALQQWFEDKPEKPFYSCIFDSDATDCYAWGISKNDYFIFGGAFDVKNGKEKFNELKVKLKEFGFCFAKPVKTEACLVLRPANPFQFCCGKNNAFLIGEAAGFISPSSLEGIGYALESAYILSRIFNNNKISNFNYAKAVLPLKLKLVLKLVKNPFMYNKFLRKLVMKSGLQSIKMINLAD